MTTTRRERGAALVGELLRLGVYLARAGGRLMAPLGLSQQQSVVLITVARREPLRQTELRSGLLYERSNVSKAVAFLEKKGLLRVRRCPEDGRAAWIETTAKGRGVVDACLAAYDEWNAAWLAEANDKEIERTTRFLRDLVGRVPD